MSRPLRAGDLFGLLIADPVEEWPLRVKRKACDAFCLQALR
jgi:hypothetical protein